MNELSDIFAGLDDREIAYVNARASNKSDRSALKEAGLSYGWFAARDKDNLNQRAFDLKQNTVLRARMILSENVARAAQIKVEGLDLRDQKMKQAAASEILDRAIGKPKDEVKLSGEIGTRVIIEYDQGQTSAPAPGADPDQE